MPPAPTGPRLMHVSDSISTVLCALITGCRNKIAKTGTVGTICTDVLKTDGKCFEKIWAKICFPKKAKTALFSYVLQKTPLKTRWHIKSRVSLQLHLSTWIPFRCTGQFGISSSAFSCAVDWDKTYLFLSPYTPPKATPVAPVARGESNGDCFQAECTCTMALAWPLAQGPVAAGSAGPGPGPGGGRLRGC